MVKITPVLKEIELDKIVFSSTYNMRESLYPRKFDSLAGQAKSKMQPRDFEDVNALERSIGEFGVLQNIIVRETKNGHYEVISGHRRVYALKKERNIHSVLALVYPHNTPDYVALEIALAENFQRKPVSKATLGDLVVEYVVMYINQNKLLGSSEKVSNEDIIKALWVIHDRMFPGGISKSITVPEFLEKFIDFVDTLARKLLERLGIDYYIFISDIFPLVADKELREAYERGNITLNDVRFLAKFSGYDLKKRMAERATLAQAQIIRRSSTQPTGDVVDTQDTDELDTQIESSISGELSSVLSQSYSEQELEELRQEFVKMFSKNDYENKEVIKHQAEKIGVKKEDLSEPSSDLEWVLKEIRNEEKKKNILDDFIEKNFPDIEPTDKEIITQKELVLNEEIENFDNLSIEGKAAVADNVVLQCSDFSKNRYAKEVEDILSIAKAEAISQVIHEIKRVLSVSKSEETLKQIQDESEIGLKNQVKLRTLAKYYKALGEEIEKRYLSVPDDKKGNLINAFELMWVLIFLRMNREIKNQMEEL